jgi:inosine-uridine nucleoside N-ribohydrolase
MKKRKLIMDVDTGSDDAVAIISALLSPEFEVLGIATVNGNRCVEYTTENTLRVVEMLKSNVPVYKGCAYPLVACMLGKRPDIPRRENLKEHEIHGNFLEMMPKASIREQGMNAVSWYIETLLAAKDGEITIVPVGPLTNLAHVFAIEPRTIPKVKEIMCMGGGYIINNITSGAEYNIWVDPEAAQIVLDAGVKFTWVPLDATHAAYMTKADADKIRSIGSRPSNVVADLIEQRIQGYKTFQTVDEPEAAPIHDSLCIAALLDPGVLLDVIPAHCQVDCGGGPADGQTIFDIRNGRVNVKAPNCHIAVSADRKKFVDIIYNILIKAK